jgi:hypothetical protein
VHPDKILSLALRYDTELHKQGITASRSDENRTFSSLTPPEILAHARFLAQGIPAYVSDPGKLGKANRHLAALQMCLSFAGLYTLRDLMEHNKP